MKNKYKYYWKIERNNYGFYNGNDQRLGSLEPIKKEWVWTQQTYTILGINELLEIVLKINKLNQQKVTKR